VTKKSSGLPFPPAPDAAAEGELPFGSISGVFGVAGEVRLHLHHRESTLLADGLDVVLVDPDGRRWQARLRSRPGAGRRVLGRFDGITLTREQAASLKGWEILVRVADLPELEEGEFWVWQTIDADVVVAGDVVGRVRHVHSTGPVEVFEVRTPGRREPVFVPAVTEAVVEVQPGRVELTPGAWGEASS